MQRKRLGGCFSVLTSLGNLAAVISIQVTSDLASKVVSCRPGARVGCIMRYPESLREKRTTNARATNA